MYFPPGISFGIPSNLMITQAHFTIQAGLLGPYQIKITSFFINNQYLLTDTNHLETQSAWMHSNTARGWEVI